MVVWKLMCIAMATSGGYPEVVLVGFLSCDIL
jgi:hypothetical protein